MLAPQKQSEYHLCVDRVFTVAVGHITKIGEALFARSAQPSQSRSHLHAPRQVTDHVVVGSHDQLRVHVVGIDFEHAFMVVARPHRVAQGRKPCPLHQPGIDGELGAGNPATIENVHVFRFRLELPVFQRLGPPNKFLDALLHFRLGRAGSAADKAIVGVIPGIHRPGIIKVVHQHRGKQMVHREGIVRMPLQDLFELLRRAIVVHVIEVIESGFGLGIVRYAVASIRGAVRLTHSW